MGTVDSLMVSSLGDNEVSAVGVANQAVMSLMTIFFLVNAGASVVTANRWGAGDRLAAGRTAAMAVKINLYAGLAIRSVCRSTHGGTGRSTIWPRI